MTPIAHLVMRRLLWMSASIALLMTTACRSTQQAANTTTTPYNTTRYTTAQQHLTHIANQPKQWQTLKAGGNLQLAGRGKSFSSAIQLRMAQGYAISISLRPLLGIEVGKLIIFGDSIILVDKIHKKYFAEKASILTAGMPVGVADVQNILLGRAFELGAQPLCADNAGHFTATFGTDSLLVLTPQQQPEQFDYSFVFNRQNIIQQLTVTPHSMKQPATYGVDYTDVKTSPAGPVASQLGIATTLADQPASINIRYDKLQWDIETDIDTSVPRSYQRIQAKELINLLSSF